jgi:glucose/arabinose dehydrogenase
MALGPDGMLYVAIGVPCNVCDRDADDFATIVRMRPDGSARSVVARGVRNSVGFTWHPVTGQLWFTDNGRDMLGDNVPPCELNRLSRVGEHFGFPFCHGRAIADPEFGTLGRCAAATAPVQELGPHVAPLGLRFYTGRQFPREYRGDLFVAEHGSWNRSEKIGYRVMRVRLKGDRAVGYEEFLTGWLTPEGRVTGRPVDILVQTDGSLLVSDDVAGAIYRVFWTGAKVGRSAALQ